MRVLLDTNILISREDPIILDQTLQDLMRLINKLQVEILIHPKSIDDISRDKNDNRKKLLLSKLKAYNFLENPPDPTSDLEFMNTIGTSTKPNDIVDNFLIYSILKNAVDFLITEDVGIHKKSKPLGLSERILYIGDAIILFQKDLPKEKVLLPPAIIPTTMANLNLKDTIFDSLREDYPNFNGWFVKKAREGRTCWIYKRDDNTLGAVLIYKIENEEIASKPVLPPQKRVKIASMKVLHVGYKIGELFLRLSIDLAINNDCSEIYLTHFTQENDYLVDLIEEYGFVNVAVKIWPQGYEDVFVKEILIDKEKIKSEPPFVNSRLIYPNFYDGINVKKHIIPIQPSYHVRLFTDFRRRQTSLDEFFGKLIIEGNTIKKAYLSNSGTKKLNPGDLILFYRSRDEKALVTLGVVEKVIYDQNHGDQVVDLVGKRSVYSSSEIEDIVRKPTTVILFNYHFHFKKSISYDKLKESQILKGRPQSITEISHENYLKIKKWGKIDERFTFN